MAKRRKKALGYILATSMKEAIKQKQILKRVCREQSVKLIETVYDVVEPGMDPATLLTLRNSLEECEAEVLVVNEWSTQMDDETLMGLYPKLIPFASDYTILLMDDLEHPIKKGKEVDPNELLVNVFRGIGGVQDKTQQASKMLKGKTAVVAAYPLASMDRHSIFGFTKADNPDFKEIRSGVPKSILVVNEEEMALVRKMYNWALEGLSMSKIAIRLEELGLKSPLGYGKENKSAKGYGISKQFVSRILHNPLYKGIREWQGEEYFTGEEYVPKKIWKKVQTLMKKSRLSKSNKTKLVHPLRGIVRCACGENTSLVYHSSGAGIQCSSRSASMEVEKKSCPYYGIMLHILVSAVWYDFCKEILSNSEDGATSKKIRDLQESAAFIREDIRTREQLVSELGQDMKKAKGAMLRRIAKIQEAHQQALESLYAQNEELSSAIKQEVVRVGEKAWQKVKPKAMTAPFKKHLKRVLYVSVVQKRGFVVIDYKSGVQKVYLYEYTHRMPHLYALGEGYRYDEKTKQVVGGDNIQYTPSDLLDNSDFPLEPLPVHWMERWLNR